MSKQQNAEKEVALETIVTKAIPTQTVNNDVLETIKKLSDLKDSGVITQEEFEAKKTELLAKL